MSRAILIALLTAVMLPAVADAKKPPQGQSLFIGEVQNGKFPDHLRFGAHHVSDEVPERIMACLAIRRPVRTRPNPWFGDDYAAYGLRWRRIGKSLIFGSAFSATRTWMARSEMPWQWLANTTALAVAMCSRSAMSCTLRLRMRNPCTTTSMSLGYPGLVWKQGGAPSMELDRVTEKVPQGQRPAGACRSIAMASSLSEPARLFYDSATCFQGEVEVREIQAAERDKSLPRRGGDRSGACYARQPPSQRRRRAHRRIGWSNCRASDGVSGKRMRRRRAGDKAAGVQDLENRAVRTGRPGEIGSRPAGGLDRDRPETNPASGEGPRHCAGLGRRARRAAGFARVAKTRLQMKENRCGSWGCFRPNQTRSAHPQSGPIR